MRLKYVAAIALLFSLVLFQGIRAQTSSDVLLRYPGQYSYELQGDYTQWEYGALYTQSSGASLSVFYALTRNINVYGGVGLHSFIIDDPATSSSRLTQGLHLNYQLGARFQWNSLTFGGGIYQHFVTGKQEHDVYRVLSDTTREFMEHRESQFSELAPIGYFGLVNYQFSQDISFGLEAVYRDPENFIIRFRYFKIQF